MTGINSIEKVQGRGDISSDDTYMPELGSKLRVRGQTGHAWVTASSEISPRHSIQFLRHCAVDACLCSSSCRHEQRPT